MVRDGTYAREGIPSSEKRKNDKIFLPCLQNSACAAVRTAPSGMERFLKALFLGAGTFLCGEHECPEAVLQALFVELPADEDEAGAGEAFRRPAPADLVTHHVKIERFAGEDDLPLGAVHVFGQAGKEGVEAFSVHDPVSAEHHLGKLVVVMVVFVVMPVFMIVLVLMIMLFFLSGVFHGRPVGFGHAPEHGRIDDAADGGNHAGIRILFLKRGDESFQFAGGNEVWKISITGTPFFL